MKITPAFTLLEVLAAIVLIGIIVAVVTPLLLRTGGAATRIEYRLEAEAELEAELTEAPLPAGDGTRPVHRNADWTLTWVSLMPSSNAVNDRTMVARRWVHVRIRGPLPEQSADRVFPLPVPRMPPVSKP